MTFLVPLTFLESLLVVLINYFDLLIPVKLTTPHLLETKVFLNKRHHVINSTHDITNNISSRK